MGGVTARSVAGSVMANPFACFAFKGAPVPKKVPSTIEQGEARPPQGTTEREEECSSPPMCRGQRGEGAREGRRDEGKEGREEGTRKGKRKRVAVPAFPATRKDTLACIQQTRKDTLACIQQWRQTGNSTASVDDFHEYLVSRADPDGGPKAFTALIAVLLSVQCRDATALACSLSFESTWGAHDDGLITPSIVLNMGLEAVETQVKRVNFHKTKAKYIYGAATLIHEKHHGRVPATFKGLAELPGVGPKISILMLTVVLGQPRAGIVVDSNVHRVAGRLGWRHPDADAERTRKELEDWVPQNAWADFSLDVIAFGQRVCLPGSKPRCSSCPASDQCLFTIKARSALSSTAIS